MKVVVLIMFVLLLAGCNEPPRKIERTSFQFNLKIRPELKTDGLTVWTDERCDIYLKEYPTCLLHELRLCIEGNWHDEKPNGEDCY